MIHVLRFLVFSLIVVISSCHSPGNRQAQEASKTPARKKQVCDASSEWRDHNGQDYCSYYSKQETCSKLIGKLSVLSRLHKNMLAKGVFEGGMSSRWFEIEKTAILYYKPSGEIADKGTCSCSNGKLKIDWETGDNVPEECTVYFRSADTVELRYHDYPFDFNALQYDQTKPATNPTIILGTVERQ